MGTITVKNLSTIKDADALELAAIWWKDKPYAVELAAFYGVTVIKKGHTFRIFGSEEETYEKARI